MDSSTFPTKGNLINARNNLKLSKQGYELLDKKRNILITEMMSLINRAQEIQSKIDKTFLDAYKALQTANIFIGIDTVQQVGYSVAEENSVEVRFRSVMGVEIPMVRADIRDMEAHYSFFRTSIALDEAFQKFNEVKKLVLDLAEIENAVYRLAENVKKTQKRANALKNILIPRYEELSNFIQSYLEEKEREEFTRLKLIKDAHS